jgi:hypothetical protein
MTFIMTARQMLNLSKSINLPPVFDQMIRDDQALSRTQFGPGLIDTVENFIKERTRGCSVKCVQTQTNSLSPGGHMSVTVAIERGTAKHGCTVTVARHEDSIYLLARIPAKFQ